MYVLVFLPIACSFILLLPRKTGTHHYSGAKAISTALLFKDSYLYLRLTYHARMQAESNTALLLFRQVSHTPSSPHKAVPHLKVVERSGSNGDKQMWCGID